MKTAKVIIIIIFLIVNNKIIIIIYLTNTQINNKIIIIIFIHNTINSRRTICTTFIKITAIFIKKMFYSSKIPQTKIWIFFQNNRTSVHCSQKTNFTLINHLIKISNHNILFKIIIIVKCST